MKLLKLPLVSFVVTSFNYEKYIINALESIKNQTYENIEIIVVDDASIDKSVDKINDFIAKNKDLNIKLIQNYENEGQLGAILTGLEYVEGQFVSFIDSDDILIKDYAKTLIRVHMAMSVAFASAQLVEIGENDEIHTTYSVSSFQKEKNYELKSLDELLKIDVDNVDFKVLTPKEAPFGNWYWSPMSANMFRTASLKMLLKYDTPQNWNICPDKFILNFAHLIGGSVRVYAPLVGYRRHNDNAGESRIVCGCKRYNNDNTTKINIQNNFRIRFDMLNFIAQNSKDFQKEYGTRNVLGFYLQILWSFFRIGVRKVK